MNRIRMKSNVLEQELSLVDNKIVLEENDDIDLEYIGNDIRLVFDIKYILFALFIISSTESSYIFP